MPERAQLATSWALDLDPKAGSNKLTQLDEELAQGEETDSEMGLDGIDQYLRSSSTEV